MYCVTKPLGITPKWVDEYLTDTNDMIMYVVKNPGRVVAGLGQSITDTIEQEGIAYGISYVVTDATIGILLTKGMGSIGKVGSAAKTLPKVDDAAKGASGADDILNMNPLDQSVNRSLGVQIKNAIKEYPDSTRFGDFNIK